MTTIDDLKDWELENGEDVMFDGPYDYTEDQYDELMQNISDAYVAEFGCAPFADIFDFFDMEGDDVDMEEAHDIALQCFADLINKYGLNKTW